MQEAWHQALWHSHSNERSHAYLMMRMKDISICKSSADRLLTASLLSLQEPGLPGCRMLNVQEHAPPALHQQFCTEVLVGRCDQVQVRSQHHCRGDRSKHRGDSSSRSGPGSAFGGELLTPHVTLVRSPANPFKLLKLKEAASQFAEQVCQTSSKGVGSQIIKDKLTRRKLII